PSTDITLNRTAGTAGGATTTMILNTFTSNNSGTLTAGSDALTVGATLAVGTSAAQGYGTYSGSFNVTVQYN
ncbi:MAG: DUF4402 domain-containing protein, partial [Thermoanaerobaculia bacterium]